MELALEGERRCKKGDCRAGVAFLEEAVNKPDAPEKSDSRTLSAIYRWILATIDKGANFLILRDLSFIYHSIYADQVIDFTEI